MPEPKSFLTFWNPQVPLPVLPQNPTSREMDVPSHCSFFMRQELIHQRLTSKGQFIEIRKGVKGATSLYIDGKWQLGTDYHTNPGIGRNDWGDDCHLAFLDMLKFSVDDLSRAKILIIGGGDLGLAGLLISNGAARISQYELDEEVVEVCKKYIPEITMPALLSKELNIKYCDGFEEIKKNKENTFDAIIGDLTGDGAALFNDDEKLAPVKLACKNDGIIITHFAEGRLNLPKVHSSFIGDGAPNFAAAVESPSPQHSAWSVKKLIKDPL